MAKACTSSAPKRLGAFSARGSPHGAEAAADGTTLQTIPYTATIYQNQTTPPAGTYTDNVVVDVSF